MRKPLLLACLMLALGGFAQNKSSDTKAKPETKPIVYQVFTRLFGNANTTNQPWGTKEQNGVGKFNDFSDKALAEIRDLGATHIWYTGVPHHALVGDYTKYGIAQDDPDVVKGRAGSPYAVKDYYDVNPDLAVNPARRMQEFEALIKRTHNNGLKLIIDIVPNHVARAYDSKQAPRRIKNFGADDDTSVAYAKNNNFYYIPGESFQVPDFGNDKPLGGQPHPLADGKFSESPAKWTGNGSREAKPSKDDWYETVKINYGISPDGERDFPSLPHGYDKLDYKAHYEYWKGKQKQLPDSWLKFRDIALFWIEKGVDGFRYDMAEMVPVEFWSFMNSSIKMKNPDAFLLAEVYNPEIYRDYIHLGKMDYLYDKVGLYDTLKAVVQGKSPADAIAETQTPWMDVRPHLLNFLENHDEQRIASAEFAGNAHRGKPMMTLSTLIGSGPVLVYFGQEVGEAGKLDSGFGKPSRTTIFDYAGVPNHQRWMNNGAFDGGKLTAEEKQLRDFYVRLLRFARTSPALLGGYEDLQSANKNTKGYSKDIFSFVRHSDKQKLLVVCNFSSARSDFFELEVSRKAIADMGLKDGSYILRDQLYGKSTIKLVVVGGVGKVNITIAPSESFVYEIK